MSKITFEFELVDHYPTSPRQVQHIGADDYNVCDNNCVTYCIRLTANSNEQSNVGVSENLLLKAIAVAQDPNLITRV